MRPLLTTVVLALSLAVPSAAFACGMRIEAPQVAERPSEPAAEVNLADALDAIDAVEEVEVEAPDAEADPKAVAPTPQAASVTPAPST